MKIILLLLPLSFFWANCTSTKPSAQYGIATEHAGYVPARIAVMPCQVWPVGARFRTLPLTNTPAAVNKELCDKFDEHVVEGFADQPYMRGFSPKWVRALAENAGKANIVNELPQYWDHRAGDCVDCVNAPSFYLSSIKNRAEWRLWLSELSKSVRHADAVLLPFVMYSYESKFVDRGLFVSKRAAGVDLLLVDTNQGYLLWSGQRNAFALNQELEQQPVANAIDYPSWTTVHERLFVEDVWKDFPGRQTYR